MPNKKHSYWTTDLPLEVYSANLVAYWYDKPNQFLYVRFNNKSVYKYWGVPYGVYEAMTKASSQGSYFHYNIRQSFNYKNLGQVEFPTEESKLNSLRDSILPENKKLEALDAKEQALDNLWNKGSIDIEEYNKLRSIIYQQKDVLIAKLEKKGYFDSETQEEQPEYTNQFKPSRNEFIAFLDNMAIVVLEIAKVSCNVILFILKGTMQLMGAFFGLMFVLMK
jgi:hypothetical protein